MSGGWPCPSRALQRTRPDSVCVVALEVSGLLCPPGGHRPRWWCSVQEAGLAGVELEFVAVVCVGDGDQAAGSLVEACSAQRSTPYSVTT